MYRLRPYQRRAVETLARLAREKQFLLLQAATGAGKTLMAASLMGHYAGRWGFRCLFLAHRAVLVRQTLARLHTVFANADEDIDCLCASVAKPGRAESRLIVASPQTLARRLDDLPVIDLVLIDECHRVPPKNQPSLYADILAAVTARRPGARVLGCTATPWRLGQGPIYGPARPGVTPWWDALDMQLSIAELQADGWLCPLRVKVCSPARDLREVPVGASGDFREDLLERTLLKPLHLGSAVAAVQREAGDRRRVAVFCVTVAHARALAGRFQAAGYRAAAVDSRAGSEENAAVLEDFAAGRLQVLCSVGMLTEGWDCPATDCLLLCRPTLSPALYVQMTGRGLRTAPGKTDCLLLDLSGNVLRHGSPNAPVLSRGAGGVPAAAGGRGGNAVEEEGRHCPFCGARLFETAGLSCPDCSAPFFDLTEEARSFQELDLARLERWTKRGEEVREAREQARERARAEEKARAEKAAEERARAKARLLNEGRPVRARLLRAEAPTVCTVSRGPAAGVRVLRAVFLVDIPGLGLRGVRMLLDPEARMGRRARQTFWVHRETRAFWALCGQGPFPDSAAGLAARWASLRLPGEVFVRESVAGWIKILWQSPEKSATVEQGALRGAQTED